MNFLLRFLKVYLFALVLSALGALVFYWLVIRGNNLRGDVSRDEFISTVRLAVGGWVGFITFMSFVLAITGMKKSISVAVYDRQAFLNRVGEVVTGLRYRLSRQDQDELVFKPPVMAVLAEKVTVRLNPDSAIITAPSGIMKKIKEGL